MRLFLSIAVAVLAGTTISSISTAHDVLSLKGWEGRTAYAARASADGKLLIGTSSIDQAFACVATTWAAPDWQPRVVPTPVSYQDSWIVAASADGRVFGSDNPGWDVNIWWDGRDTLPTIYDQDYHFNWLVAISASGNAAIGHSEDVSNPRGGCIFTRDGIWYPLMPSVDNLPGFSCISP
ncbi:MAG: hypothetical protein SFY96_06970 [Planctomycetota bacterium]|nr:hypothetical protein [Planctomycetota bacterium]